jgi:heme-degrading monooxygenase HmoA
MIARMWSAQTTSGQLPGYLDHLHEHVVPALRLLDGYVGVTILDRPLTDGMEVMVITYWRSIDAIRAFAGTDVDRAVVAKEAAAILSRFDEHVRHYVVAFSDSPESGKRA